MSINLTQSVNDYQFRLSLEQAILTTLLFKDLSLDKDFDKYLDYKLDYKLFNSNQTNKLVAKAIHNFNESEQPYDEETIARYISKYTLLNQNEYVDILAKKPISYPTFVEFVKTLKEMHREEKIAEMTKGL